MRPELQLKALYLASQIKNIIPEISEDISQEKVLSKWINFNPVKKEIFAVAEDGSLNKKHFLGFYLYAVSGYSYGAKNEEEYVEEVVGDINISVIKKTERADSYFRLLMFLSELKSIIKLAKREKPDLLLIDGTLSSKFIVSPPKTDWFLSKEFGGRLAEVSGLLIDDIKNKLYDEDITSFSYEIQLKAMKLIKDQLNESPRRDILEAFLSKLAYFEYLLLLYDLFYSLDYNPYIVGIAKTSHDTQLFNASIPDLRLLHKYVYENGYTKPLTISIESKAKEKTQEWEFSEVFEKKQPDIANALKEITIKYFYGKYDKGRIISLIEVYENPQKESVNPEEILNYLAYLSTGGYPYHLKKADKEVRITKDDMQLIINILGLQNEITGREELI